MTCYLRIHNILAAVRPKSECPDWDSVNLAWQRATSVLQRKMILSEMRLDEVDLYDLPNADLSPYCGLIMSGRVDQNFLYENRDVLAGFLEQGKTIVFSGDIDLPWLPGSAPALPFEARQGDDLTVRFADHPVFEGISPVSTGGYFISGHHPLPKGGRALATLPHGEVVIYEDKASTAGTILVHAGHTLLGYAADARAEALSKRLIPQLLSWIRTEASV